MSDMKCPHCGFEWDDIAGDCADHAGNTPMNSFVEECFNCRELIRVHVSWEPVFYVDPA